VGFELDSNGLQHELEISLLPKGRAKRGILVGATGFVPIPNERRNAASWEMTETVEPTRRERK